jgi:hypothetical protein
VRRGTLISIGISAFAAVAVLAGPASAGVAHHGGYSYVSKGFKVGGKSLKRHLLDCPNGKHVYGGGISAKGPFGKLLQRQSYPADRRSDSNKTPDDAWGVLVDNSSKHHLKARMVAVCGPANPSYLKTHMSLAAGADTNELDSQCDTNVIGGGVEGSKGILFEDGGPYDTDTWYSYSQNTAASTGHIDQWAICAALSTQYLVNGGQMQPMSTLSYRIACPDGYSPTGGGSSTSGSVRTTTSVPYGVYKGWFFRGDFLGNFFGSAEVLVACTANLD